MPTQDDHKPTQQTLIATKRTAWLALFWENFWPLIVPFLCVVALFLAFSWMGFWSQIPDAARISLLVVFGVAGILSLWPLRQLTLPGRESIDHRIETASHLQHRPVTAQDDVRADMSGASDPFAKALWQEHQRRMAGTLENLKVGTPVPEVAKKDPYALRALVGLFLFIGIAAGWGDWSSRIGDAFRVHAQQVVADTGRIDAWVKPPAYTNRPPIFLDQQTASVSVPEGSELVVRVLDIDKPSVSIVENEKTTEIEAEKPDSKKDGDGAAQPANASTKPAEKTPRSFVFKSTLGETAVVKLKSGDDPVRDWAFVVLADNDPTIEFVEEPVASNRGALEFSYEVTDDYGVIAAIADIKNAKQKNKDARPLIEAPEVSLPLPRRRAKEGTSKTSQDLTAHPWAGATVTMKLTAEDEAGQKGSSAVKQFTLPERVFTKPLARAVVEERRNLALDANAAQKVAEMLNIITDTHPDEFIKDISVFTSLRVAYRTIARAESDETLKEALELLWETALAIEDGDLSLAERRLRDAQERLSKALENGASDKEIDELMKELRAAMDSFMRELAEQMQRNQQNQQAMPMNPNTQVLRQQDIDRLMKQIEDLAKSGSKDAARQLLQDLQRMMNNLQTARPGQQNQQQQSDEFSQQMNKLGEMMRKQQELMDQTFDMQRRQQQQGQQQGQQGQQRQNQQGQQRNQPGQQGQQKPMTPEEFAEAMKKLQQQQGELQRQMQELQKGLSELGMDPGKLGEAGEAMRQAEGELGKGETGQATGQQGRALQAMREGAQQMMRNMQNQAGEQGRRGERGQHGEQSREDRDPLGRQSRSEGPQLGDDTKVPGEIDAQRARRILDAIRRKLGETTRPRLELDYLDRLLPTR